MQKFVCPQCGHTSTYDPWVESAKCPQCGHTPDKGIRIHGRPSKKPSGSHQSFLNELLAHWDGSHKADRSFNLQTIELAEFFFRDYQRTMGEDPHLASGRHMRYVRSHHPSREEILELVGAYLLLRRGNIGLATQRLRDLTYLYPKFADGWIWRTATTDDPAERREYLEQALLNEPAHPIARDAMAVLRGVLKEPAKPRPDTPQLLSIHCSQCGGSLQYAAGATEVHCPFCSHETPLQQINVLDETTPMLGDLQLQRRYQDHIWKEVERIVHCQSCAAMLTMTRRLAEHCPFCGSTNVLLEDSQIELQQPDGFLSFQIDERQAGEAVQGKLQSGLRKLKTWWTGDKARQGHLEGLYIPFWVFDGFVEVRTWQSTMSSAAPLPGGPTLPTDTVMLDNLIFPAFETPKPRLLWDILPYKLDAMTPYEPKLLANWPAALYQRDVEQVVEDAYQAMIAIARRQAGPLILLPEQQSSSSPFGRPTTYRRAFQVSGVTYQLILLPVWLQIVHEGEQQRLAVVNGQTGKTALGKILHSDV